VRLKGWILRTVNSESGGYGFVCTSDKKQFFFHCSECPDSALPTVGARVEFEAALPLKPTQEPRAVKLKVFPART